ncbi:MAG: zinc ABC transporter substrate-binding protein [Dysgonamonadaceae bacterium]|jgi:zinc transport system substrate-binding protein|nr:zinc ABC transporter substrate-binding protein [Dysgonamonadaceae bacterium]
MKRIYSCFVFSVLAILFLSCNDKGQRKPTIVVTIEPQRYFVEQLADSLFEVVTMVPAGISPETYDPTPVQMATLAQSCAYFRIGKIGFEQVWMEKIRSNNPQLPIYDNGEGIDYIVPDEAHGHSEGADPHTWVSTKEALIIVENMCNALIALDKSHERQFRSNLERLKMEIHRTDSLLTELLADIPVRSFLIYHPALTYFARDFQLKQYCIETDGKEPSAEQMKALVDIAEAEGVKAMFVQQEFDRKNAEIIAQETGCRLEVINPLSYHWSEELIRIAKILADE